MMAEGLGLKLLSLKISDCTSEGELKSVFKEVTTSRSDSEDILKAIVTSIKSQLCYSIYEKTNEEEINNVLTFIKSLAETTPQFGAQRLDEFLVRDENGSTEYVNGTPALSPTTSNDFIYEYIIEPLQDQLWDHINLILINHCKSSIQTLSSTKGPTTLSTHELLSLLHKLIRTSLSLLKRVDLANTENGKTTNEKLTIRLIKFGETVCDLMQNMSFDLSLDIRCNMGLSLCYVLNILKLSGSDTMAFLWTVFSKDRTKLNENGLKGRIFDTASEDINRIALAFGVLGTLSMTDKSFIRIMAEIGEDIVNIDHGTKEATNLGSARVLEIWTEKLSHAGKDILQELSPIFVDLEFFIFSYLPGHIDAVKTCCRYALGNLAKIYDRMEDPDCSDLVVALLKKVLVKPLHIKWVGISCIARNTPKAVDIMNIEDDLPETFLCCQRTSTNPCSDSYLSLMAQQFLQVDEAEWETNWIDPLFRNQQTQSHESNWPQKRSIMLSIMKGRNEELKAAILRSVMKRMNSSLLLCKESLLLAVEAIKIATDLEIKVDKINADIQVKDTDSFRGVVSRDGLHSWLVSGDPQIRLAGFSLLVETKKTSELIPFADFESLKIMFRYSFMSQNPAFRQQFLSYFKKLLKRLTDSQNLVLRNRDLENIMNYDDFMKWLWNFLTAEEGLFPGSNFGRRCQSLECLAELVNRFDMDRLGVKPCVENLKYIEWLHDTYEYNKVKALHVLSKIPMPDLVEGADITTAILNQAFDLCESVKPPNSLTGRYLIIFLIQKCHRKDGDKYSPWSLLSTIFNKLKGIFDKVVCSSLIEVAADTPMYGYIRCIRMIFNESKEFLTHWEKYRDYSKNLLDLCLQLDDILFPVLGSAAPEGFLPGLPDSQPQNSKVVRSINAQMLLVCSWRSMKDVCLLLAEMCVLFPLEGESEKYILSYDQVSVIGDHLLFLLKNLMHRGVFEQVYIGFRELAARLFKSSSQRLNELPEKWLNGAMDDDLVKSKSITRRSAGLPFIFQALLSPVSSNEAFVGKFVTKLFSPDSTSSPSVRIHAMNVLRALFRDTTISRVMMPYVPSGLQLAFKGLQASDWTERNSGLMLFGALIRRTFGPKLNLMSAPTFFRKFPHMYDFLLAEIRSCCSELESKGYMALSDFTFHVLLLLSSFTCNGVVEDKHFRLVNFIPPIRACASSADCQVRKIAGKALIPFLINPIDKVNIIVAILNDLHSEKNNSANRIHGNFVQFQTVLGTITDESHRNDVIVNFNHFISRSSSWCTGCPTIFEVLFDICVDLGEGAILSHRAIKANFEATFGRNTENRRSVPGLPLANMKSAAAEVFFVLGDDMANHFCECIYNWMQNESIVFVEEVLIYLCEQTNNRVKWVKADEEMSLVLYSIANRYLYEDFELYCLSTAEERFLQVMSEMPVEVFQEWAKFVNREDFLHLFGHLLRICETLGGKIESKAYALIILGNMALKTENQYLDNDDIENFCDLLTHFCDSNLDDDIRLAVAKCIPKLPSANLESFPIMQQLKIWYGILVLCQDDELSVRTEIGTKIWKKDAEMCERRSLEVVVGLFLTNFVSKYTFEGLVLLVGLLLRDDFEIRALEADDGEEDRLFDKSEMNSFNEPILLAKILVDELENHPELKDHMKIHFTSTHLNVDLGDFFIFASSSTLPPSPEREILTLQSLCEIVSEELTSYVDVQSCSTTTACTAPTSEKHFVLKWIRKFVLSVLS